MIKTEIKNLYTEIIDTISDLYDNVYSKEKEFKFKKAEILVEFDCYLQAILYKVARSDRSIAEMEYNFIINLTEYGDLFEKSELEELSEEDVSNRIEKQLEIVPVSFLIFMDYDMTLLKTKLNDIARIVEILSKIDGTFKIQEKDSFFESISKVLELVEKEKLENLSIKFQSVINSNNLLKLHAKKIKRTTDLRKQYASALVYIETKKDDFVGMGSGFIISPDGYIVTCSHVTMGLDVINVRIKLMNDSHLSLCVEAKVVDNYEQEDLAILKIDGLNLPYMPIALESDEINSGDDVILLGYPFGKNLSDSIHELNYSITKGIVSSLQIKDGIKRVMLDIDAKSGNSGGPVIDLKRKKVIGVLLGSHIQGKDYQEEINYMRPISYIWKKINE